MLEDQYTVRELPDGTLIYVSPRTAGKFLSRLCHYPDGRPRWYLDWLTRQGHPAEIIYLYLYPFGSAGRRGRRLFAQSTAVRRGGRQSDIKLCRRRFETSSSDRSHAHQSVGMTDAHALVSMATGHCKPAKVYVVSEVPLTAYPKKGACSPAKRGGRVPVFE